MENNNQNKEAYEKAISAEINKIISPIFDKVLQETPSNHTMVGTMVKKSPIISTPSLYNPHNYRIYFSFTKEKYKPKEGMVGVWFGKFKNYGKEFTAIGEGIRVTIKKTKAEIINKLSEEEWFLVNRATAKEEITAILKRIDTKCISSFNRFIDQYGGSSDFIIINKEDRAKFILNTKCDNKLMKEPFIDNLPLDMTFETSIVKKLYKEPVIEYKTALHAAQHLENSALNNYGSQILQAIVSLSQNILLLSNETKNMAYNASSHIALIQAAKDAVDNLSIEVSKINKKDYLSILKSKCKTVEDIIINKEIVSLLTEAEKLELSNWCFGSIS